MPEAVAAADVESVTLKALGAWAARHCGLSFPREQVGLLADRVDALCRTLGRSRGELLTRLQDGDHDLALRFAEAVSTNHTFFFREPETFAFLARRVLPNLPEGPIRIWSAAASSGDEAFSIAITAYEALGGEAPARIRILGTDLSDRQVRAAERGLYPEWELELVSPERRARWFTPAPHRQHRVARELREMCTFRRMNLTQLPWPFEQRFHVIFLRNVLYYFDDATRARIVEACFDAAEPGSWLITSLTEPMISLSTRWSMVKPAVYRRTSA